MWMLVGGWFRGPFAEHQCFFNWDHRLGFMQICLIQTATSGTDMFFDQYGYDIFRICMDQSDPRKDLQVKSYQHSDKSWWITFLSSGSCHRFLHSGFQPNPWLLVPGAGLTYAEDVALWRFAAHRIPDCWLRTAGFIGRVFRVFLSLGWGEHW